MLGFRRTTFDPYQVWARGRGGWLFWPGLGAKIRRRKTVFIYEHPVAVRASGWGGIGLKVGTRSWAPHGWLTGRLPRLGHHAVLVAFTGDGFMAPFAIRNKKSVGEYLDLDREVLLITYTA